LFEIKKTHTQQWYIKNLVSNFTTDKFAIITTTKIEKRREKTSWRVRKSKKRLVLA